MDARSLFAAAVEKAGGPTKAAAAIGCSRGFIYALKDGKKPGRGLAVRIQHRLGVPVWAWDEVGAIAPASTPTGEQGKPGTVRR